MFDHVAPTVFWPLFLLCWFVLSLVVGITVGKVIRWCDTPANKYVDKVDVTRCERAGSQQEFARRLRSGGVR